MEIFDLVDYPNNTETIAKWYFNEWDYKDPKATLNSVIKKISTVTNRFSFVAHIDDELVGAGEIEYREYSQYLTYNYWLDGIYVPIEHRGKGISTALITYAKSKAIDLKLPAIYLRCESHLVALYETHNFQVICHEETKYIMQYICNP